MNRKEPSRKRNSQPTSAQRARGVIYVSMGLLALAGAGQLRAHLIPNPKARDLAAGFGTQASGVDQERGTFMAGDGKIVARSQDSWLIQLHYHQLSVSPDFFTELGQATGISPLEMRMGMDDFHAMKVSDPDARLTKEWDVLLNTAQMEQARKVYRKWTDRGMSLVPHKARIYPMGDSLGDVLGAASPEDEKGSPVRKVKGRTGLELTINGFLEGSKGLPDPEAKKGVRINGLTKERKKMIEERIAKNPADRVVELTIDADLQRAAFESIRRAVLKSGAEAGVALILDPFTGDLLAAADYPLGQKGLRENSKEISRYAVADAAYEPGSMMKLVTLAKAYTDGKVRPGQTFNSTSIMTFRTAAPIRNHGGLAFGTVSAEDAIAHSCNVTAARWALSIGKASFHKLLKDTKLVTEEPGLGSEGETSGLFGFTDGDRDLASLGFGQGINVPPANLAGLFGALANGGEFVAPRLIKSVAGVELPAERRGFIFSPEACRLTLEASRAVIERPFGTGHKLLIPGMDLGGKTGTAQIIRGGKVVGYRANFVGFAPLPRPRYVILAMVDRPKGADFYGGSIAGPVFVDLAKALQDRGMIQSARLAKAEPMPLARPLPPGPVQLKELNLQPAPELQASITPSRPATGQSPLPQAAVAPERREERASSSRTSSEPREADTPSRRRATRSEDSPRLRASAAPQEAPRRRRTARTRASGEREEQGTRVRSAENERPTRRTRRARVSREAEPQEARTRATRSSTTTRRTRSTRNEEPRTTRSRTTRSSETGRRSQSTRSDEPRTTRTRSTRSSETGRSSRSTRNEEPRTTRTRSTRSSETGRSSRTTRNEEPRTTRTRSTRSSETGRTSRSTRNEEPRTTRSRSTRSSEAGRSSRTTRNEEPRTTRTRSTRSSETARRSRSTRTEEPRTTRSRTSSTRSDSRTNRTRSSESRTSTRQRDSR